MPDFKVHWRYKRPTDVIANSGALSFEAESADAAQAMCVAQLAEGEFVDRFRKEYLTTKTQEMIGQLERVEVIDVLVSLSPEELERLISIVKVMRVTSDSEPHGI